MNYTQNAQLCTALDATKMHMFSLEWQDEGGTQFPVYKEHTLT